MIHIATVHWLDETWIDIQYDYFSRCLGDTPYRIYSYLNGIDEAPYREKIHYINTEPIVAHFKKLNLLAKEITSQGRPDDILIFIDGDAFPVRSFVPYVKEQLKKFPLVAIQRLENEGDPQPHPSFCATTVRFWNEIQGDWSKGPKWRTNSGLLRSDTGGVLWGKLKDLNIEWKPILRSNTVDLHPLWFGVYGGSIYHHGAAFRTPFCTIDIADARKNWCKKFVLDIADIPSISRLKGGWFQNAVYSFVLKKRIEQTKHDSQLILKEIKTDHNFYKRFFKEGSDAEPDGVISVIAADKK